MRRAILLLALVCTSALVAQSSLDPPAGPIDESGRFGTLIELSQETAPGDADSDFRISQPGSYVLTRDIDVPDGESGIVVAVDDVTIDLNGYTIRGAGSGSSSIGVRVPDASEGSFDVDSSRCGTDASPTPA